LAIDSPDPNRDLGFGSVVSRDSRKRLLNPDGSFNVVREGLGWLTSLSLYHAVLTMSWPAFLGLLTVSYLAVNALFALAFMLLGPHALMLQNGVVSSGTFLNAFFFSVQTFATIGYGEIIPIGVPANLLVTVESLVGLLGVALATGIIFARFSRPNARLMFSRNAIIGPYRDGVALMFRVTNARSSQIIELECQLLLTRFDRDNPSGARSYQALALERTKVAFFPLAWTIVHPITAESPLFGETSESLNATDAELLVLFRGIDDTASQQVHSRTSYLARDVVWNTKFRSLFNAPTPDGTLSIDIGRLDEVEPV
jgi:inward rectifier potassium channel